MKNKLLIVGMLCCVQFGYAQTDRIVANPMNLAYRFQPQDNDPARREAADPVCEYFNGKYYLFASKSGGYWSSPDLVEWTYIPCTSIKTIENYAPTILIIKNTMYFMASWEPAKIYKTSNPDEDNWQEVKSEFHFPTPEVSQDPAFFRDDDGRVYLYWGCSDKAPIYGVEVDPENGFKVTGQTVAVIEHNSKLYGWENPGNNNELNKDGWNEGPCMIKHGGKYYLQYAAPGTEFRVYADGVYVGDHPLGPFVYAESSPFSFKPGGFVGGAGHGHTFKDRYGNYWHVASMRISQRHWFERRLGLFPLYITENGFVGQHSVWTDYPFIVPAEKTDFAKNDGFAGWNLLSFRKSVTASSALEEYKPALAADERIETWWSAQTGKPGEWLQVDLGKEMTVNAIQVNFADHDFTMRAPHPPFHYRYVTEASTDGKKWTVIVDKSHNVKDAVHDLNVLPQPVTARYLRITNSRELPGKFSLYDFRIFGNGKGKAPSKVTGIK
ncbi:MAG: family 43 glycosylhydrolase, partial [Prevotellaceae bacterium]|nr:family 43 glycosylhydrolase [Prevotellaceae bacterium]